MDYESYLDFYIVGGIALALVLILAWAVASVRAAIEALTPAERTTLDTSQDPVEQRITEWLSRPDLSATLNAMDYLAFVAAGIVPMALAFPLNWGGLALLPVTLLAVRLWGASRTSLAVLKRMTRWLPVMRRVLWPFVWMLLAASRRGQSSGMLRPVWDTSEPASGDEILKGIAKFGSIDAHAIMTPRIDVEGVAEDTPFGQLISLINECGYSRLPVYDDSEGVRGILYVKDLLPYIEREDNFHWQNLIRKAYFVPVNKKIDDLLKEFQAKKIHLAVIIDEYGSMVGIVTLEDILEEIMGDIADESDDDEPEYTQTDDGSWLFDGKVTLVDFCRILHRDDAFFDNLKGDADTLAGIILELKGEIPAKGDTVTFRDLTFCVEEMDNRRIKQIKVTIHEQ